MTALPRLTARTHPDSFRVATLQRPGTSIPCVPSDKVRDIQGADEAAMVKYRQARPGPELGLGPCGGVPEPCPSFLFLTYPTLSPQSVIS